MMHYDNPALNAATKILISVMQTLQEAAVMIDLCLDLDDLKIISVDHTEQQA